MVFLKDFTLFFYDLVLLKVIFFILGLTKVPFGDYFLFFLGFLSKSKMIVF